MRTSPWPSGRARRVLLIGGALTGAPAEILRHGVTRLDCVELDPLVARLGRRFLSGALDDARVHLVEADPRQFVRRAEPGYDVVILALPDPTTAQLNRLFTREFFRETRRVLREGGVVSFALGRYENYLGAELTDVLRCARQTAAGLFRHVRLFPGGRVYFLASDEPLTDDIAGALERAGVATRWVRRSSLAATLAPDRLGDLERASVSAAPMNRDAAPVLYYLQVRLWASQFEAGSPWLLAALGLGFGLYALRLRGPAGVLFASGFAGSALEMVLLLGLQILSGSVYRQVAWVVTLFMAGLAVGAWVATRAGETRFAGTATAADADGVARDALRRADAVGLKRLAGGVALLALLLPLLLPALARLAPIAGGQALAVGVLLLVTTALAVVIGAQFPLANRLETGRAAPAARLYAADFIGASLGALLTSTWIVPRFGLAAACGLTAALNLAAMAAGGSGRVR